MTSLFDLSEEVAVVVGATATLGRAMAEGLASAGARVAVVGRNRERGHARVRGIPQYRQSRESITPGFFPAEQNRKLLFTDGGSATARARAIPGHTPMARLSEPHELVGACVFLASAQASSFVTGADIRVDGGFLSQTI